MARSRRRQQPAKEHPSHLTRAWRWWNGLELQGKLGILGLVVAVVAAIPSFIALRSSPPRGTTSAADHNGGRLSGFRQPGRAMTAQVKRALVAAGITLALSVNAAVPAAAATMGSETVHGII